MAQFYHIYDLRAYPCSLVATLAAQLPQDSRSFGLYNNLAVPLTDFLLATISDRLSWLVWAKTEDGRRNRNRPQSIAQQFLNKKKDDQDSALGFDSIEEFETYRAKFFKKGGG